MNEGKSASTPPPDEGRTLAGRYELGDVIGRGGMGTVYRAVDLILGRSVAVKTLPWLLADQDPNNVARFEREARAAAALSHPAVVSVYDTGVDAGTHFIVMELVEGRSLEAVLREHGPIAPERAASIASRVADALAAAHAQGIVHRDIKPANVMLAKDGSVKVLDFGIARAAGASTLTQSASVIGTAAYMSPEQAIGEPADERSDIYALGCVLYALLTGHPPFTGEGSAAVLHQQANSTPRPPRGESHRASPALSALVMEMLAKKPGERPQSAGEVRDRLRALARPRAGAATTATVPQHRTGVTQRMPARAGGAGGVAGVAGAVSPKRAAAAPGHERRRAIVVGAIVAGILVIALVALASGGSSPRPAASARHVGTASTATAAGTTSTPTTARSTPTAAASTPTTAAPTPTTAASTPSGPPPSVSAAADALNALLTQDVTSGAINPKAAQQIAAGLTDIVHSWDSGNQADAQNKLARLTQQTTKLEQKGAVIPAAVAPLNHALANLGAAIASASPPQAPAQPAPAGGDNPGHGGPPPGQAKKGGGGD